MYFPIIPSDNSWIPPMNKIMHTRLAQPSTLPPTVNLRTIMKITPNIEAKNEAAPAQRDILSGASEKLIKPSIEYFNKLQKFQDEIGRASCRERCQQWVAAVTSRKT